MDGPPQHRAPAGLLGQVEALLEQGAGLGQVALQTGNLAQAVQRGRALALVADAGRDRQRLLEHGAGPGQVALHGRRPTRQVEDAGHGRVVAQRSPGGQGGGEVGARHPVVVAGVGHVGERRIGARLRVARRQPLPDGEGLGEHGRRPVGVALGPGHAREDGEVLGDALAVAELLVDDQALLGQLARALQVAVLEHDQRKALGDGGADPLLAQAPSQRQRFFVEGARRLEIALQRGEQAQVAQ